MKEIAPLTLSEDWELKVELICAYPDNMTKGYDDCEWTSTLKEDGKHELYVNGVMHKVPKSAIKFQKNRIKIKNFTGETIPEQGLYLSLEAKKQTKKKSKK